MSRKNFIKLIFIFFGLFFSYLFVRLLNLLGISESKSSTQLNLPMNLPEGVSFYDRVVAYRSGNSLKFFSSRCTHLGCRINHFEGDSLVCPCHGSRFSREGFVINGPAIKNLPVLKYDVDIKNKQYIVFLHEV
jgi:cytochrome b6-f complex iron-sulfur subunit